MEYNSGPRVQRTTGTYNAVEIRILLLIAHFMSRANRIESDSTQTRLDVIAMAAFQTTR